NHRDGYMKNHSGIGPDDYNNTNYYAGRFSIVADITPDIENYTIASYSNSNTHGYAAHLEYCYGPNAPGGGALTSIPACNQIARQTARGDSVYDVEVDNADPAIKLRNWQVINKTSWHATDLLTVTNIASYDEFRERSSFSLNSDNFFSNVVPGRKFQYIV